MLLTEENSLPEGLAGLKGGDEREELLRGHARDNVQLLMNALFGLPRERVDDTLCAKLPPPAATTVLPREKPAPKPRQVVLACCTFQSRI